MRRFLAAVTALGVSASETGALAPAPPSVCGADPTKVADCNHPDLGSCGNACCYASFEVAEQPDAIYGRVVQLLKGKLDGSYDYVSSGNPPDPEEDLRQYNITAPLAFQYIFQGSHSAPKFFGANSDVLDFSVVKTTQGSAIYAFSLSRIHGALGDHGQNYKSIAYLAKALNPDARVTVVHGCGSPAEPRSHATLLHEQQELAPASVCGADPTNVEDCNRPDLGSCSNACCLLEVELKDTPEAVYASLTGLLKSKVDGQYDYITGGDPNPGDDLRQYNITSPAAFQFILQGSHSAPKYFGENADILDFTIAKFGEGSSLRMFSLSRIHGALGDHGQNYKNLAYLTKHLPIATSPLNIKVLYGCNSLSSSSAAKIMV